MTSKKTKAAPDLGSTHAIASATNTTPSDAEIRSMNRAQRRAYLKKNGGFSKRKVI